MSAPQPQAAPQPQITTPTPTSAPAASIPPQSAPAATAPNTIPTATNATSPSLNDKLNDVDRYWKFKLGGYTLCVIVGLIGIGCVGWATSTVSDDFTYGYDSSWALPWPLMTFGISLIWSFIVIVVTLLRKRPVHPGLRVAMDLLLWLGYIPTVLLALLSFSELMNWGRYGIIDGFYYYSSSSVGRYELAGNGTWIWESSRSSSSVTYPRDCTRSSRYYYDSSPNFESCAEQDAYINQLWQDKRHRMDVELTAVVCQFIALVLHFALFVWACVDTNHHNRTKVGKDAEKIAAGIVEKMIQSGAIMKPPSQTYAPPQQAYYGQQVWQPTQGQVYPPQIQQQQQVQIHPAASHAGPSNEKGFGPRYA